MRIFHSLEEYRDASVPGPSCVTLGKFDGVHIGHAKLIRSVTGRARQTGQDSVVFAIDMNGDSILSQEEREAYLLALGVDLMIECPFSRKFMNISAEDFVCDILAKTLHASYICVGTDFAFGRGRQGNVRLLGEMGDSFGFQADIVKKEQLLGEDVSSSRVRQALREGDMELVDLLLGRPYPVMGVVRHGRHIGTGIGFPTINVHPGPSKILPPDGVYASVTTLPDGTKRNGLTNVGTRPTVGGSTRKAETTLFDFHADLYGDMVTTNLMHFIRPEKTFPGLEELKQQIRIDQEEARRILEPVESLAAPPAGE